ncbi:MAG: hypothetical protein ACJASN_002894 [Cyclobacteriaceae bacterium]|jgi:hypothetical protein
MFVKADGLYKNSKRLGYIYFLGCHLAKFINLRALFLCINVGFGI